MFRLFWLVRRDDHSAIDPLLQIYYIPALYRSSERPGEPLLENDETFTVDD